MNKCKKIYLYFVGTISLILVLFLNRTSMTESLALEYEGSDSYILVDSYGVEGNKIVPGEEFSFSLTIKNPSEFGTAREVMVNVQGEAGISTVYPSFSQVYVGSMLPLEEKTISMKFTISDRFIYDYASFFISISSQSKSNSLTVTVPVDIEKRMITATSATFPEHTVNTEPVTASVLLKSFSEDNLSNVVMNIYVDGNMVASSSIGNVSAGATKTQNASFYLNEVGEHAIKVGVDFANSNGKTFSLDVYETSITVSEKPVTDATVQEKIEEPKAYSDRDIMIMVACAGATVLLMLGIVFVVRHYN